MPGQCEPRGRTTEERLQCVHLHNVDLSEPTLPSERF
jgi:hypothetical protein